MYSIRTRQLTLSKPVDEKERIHRLSDPRSLAELTGKPQWFGMLVSLALALD